MYCFLYYTSMSLGSGVPRQSSHDHSRSFRKNHSRSSRRISRLLVQPLPRGHFASVHVEINSIVEEHMTPRAEARPISRERALLIRRREGAAGGGKSTINARFRARRRSRCIGPAFQNHVWSYDFVFDQTEGCTAAQMPDRDAQVHAPS